MKLKLTFLSLLINLSSFPTQAGSNREKIENCVLGAVIIGCGAFTADLVYGLIKPNGLHDSIKTSEKELEKALKDLEKVLTQDLTPQELNELIDDLSTDEFRRDLHEAIQTLEQKRNTSGLAGNSKMSTVNQKS